jgi:hypothetical protein
MMEHTVAGGAVSVADRAVPVTGRFASLNL